MKKFLPILISFFIITLAFQIFINLFIKHTGIEYSIKTKDNAYNIKENYNKEKNNNYDFYITDNNNDKYVFSTKYNFNKQKRVIKDIVYYKDKNNNIKCILPIYKRGYIGDVNCNYKKEQVDLTYLVTNKIDISNINKYMKKFRYNTNKEIIIKDSPKEYNMSNNSMFYVYENNIKKDYTFIIWNYNGIFYISKKDIFEKEYFDKDLYDNTFSTLVDRYYLIFNFNDSTNNLDELYSINVEDYGKSILKFDNNLDNNMYINGIYKNKVYITDKKNKLEYEIDPIKGIINTVGSGNKYKVLINNKLTSIGKSDFFMKEQLFNEIKNNKIIKKYGNVDIKESNNYYYFFKDNVFYKVHKDYLNLGVKLFSFDKVTDWKVKDNDIIFISDDTMYLFTEKDGVKPIVKNSEFRFNYKNICNFYKINKPKLF